MKRSSAKRSLILMVLIFGIIVGVGAEAPRNDTLLNANDTIEHSNDRHTPYVPMFAGIFPAKEQDAPQFYRLPITDAKALREFATTYASERRELVLRLNRIDFDKIRSGDTLIIPASVERDLNIYAPFPDTLAIVGDIQKIILVSKRIQAFALYESGKRIFWGPVSTGKQSTPTPAGLYHANWKARLSRSSINRSWIMPWAVNLDNFSGIALHQFELPGYPASHACVRLRNDDARRIYEWVEGWILTPERDRIAARGTPVVIFGSYDYAARPPWHSLPEDPHAATLTHEELRHIQLYVPAILHRAASRDSVTAAAPPAL